MTKPGRAEAALERVALADRLLQRVQVLGVAEALDGEHLLAPGLDREHEARPDGDTVDDHGAGAADAVLAAEMGAGQPELFAEEVGERHAHVGGRWRRSPLTTISISSLTNASLYVLG